MCIECQNYNYVCSACGEILDTEYSVLKPYCVSRKEIKNLLWTSNSENFVWFLRFEGNIVKVGYGNLLKLLNETRPNANYIRFDSVLIYFCNSIIERNAFACKSMGEINGIVNRRGVSNVRYKTKKEMKWKTNCAPDIKDDILGEPDFNIGDNQYWDIERLREYGVS